MECPLRTIWIIITAFYFTILISQQQCQLHSDNKDNISCSCQWGKLIFICDDILRQSKWQMTMIHQMFTRLKLTYMVTQCYERPFHNTVQRSHSSGSHIGAWWHHQMETFSALLALCALNSPHKGQWRGALVFSLICAWTNGWVNNRDAADLGRHRSHYDVTVMETCDRHDLCTEDTLCEALVLFAGCHHRFG